MDLVYKLFGFRFRISFFANKYYIQKYFFFPQKYFKKLSLCITYNHLCTTRGTEVGPAAFASGELVRNANSEDPYSRSAGSEILL